ncbi:MAG: hypothetical protein OEU26_19705, partial [Candidatus Tectomicrobia bacterium]|nr:hypothetical protein [Candidatus Tectomicrobia bacterium]
MQASESPSEEHLDVIEQTVSSASSPESHTEMTPSPSPHPGVMLSQQVGEELTDESSGNALELTPAGPEPPSFVYALGRIEPRFPSLATEKEFAQATGRAETAGLTDRQALHAVLAERQYRYLVRQLCWVLTIEGLETYLLTPRDPLDLELLVEAVRPAPRPTDIDVVIGVRGPLAPPEMCNGLMVPIVVFDQIYTFDIDTLIASIPRPESIPEEEFGPAA